MCCNIRKLQSLQNDFFPPFDNTKNPAVMRFSQKNAAFSD